MADRENLFIGSGGAVGNNATVTDGSNAEEKYCHFGKNMFINFWFVKVI